MWSYCLSFDNDVDGVAGRDIGDYNRIGSGARFYDRGQKRPDAERWMK